MEVFCYPDISTSYLPEKEPTLCIVFLTCPIASHFTFMKVKWDPVYLKQTALEPDVKTKPWLNTGCYQEFKPDYYAAADFMREPLLW